MKLEVLTRKSELTLGIEARAKDRISTPCYSSSWVEGFNLGGFKNIYIVTALSNFVKYFKIKNENNKNIL